MSPEDIRDARRAVANRRAHRRAAEGFKRFKVRLAAPSVALLDRLAVTYGSRSRAISELLRGRRRQARSGVYRMAAAGMTLTEGELVLELSAEDHGLLDILVGIYGSRSAAVSVLIRSAPVRRGLF